MKIKLFSAQKATANSSVIPIQKEHETVYVLGDKKRYPAVDASAFGIQILGLGAEAAGRTGTIKVEISHDYDPATGIANFPFHTPEDMNDIKTNYSFDGAANKTESWSFAPPPCSALRIAVTLSGALTNGFDLMLIVW